MSGFLGMGDDVELEAFLPVLDYYFKPDHLFRDYYKSFLFCSQSPFIGITPSSSLHTLNLGKPVVSTSRMALKRTCWFWAELRTNF